MNKIKKESLGILIASTNRESLMDLIKCIKKDISEDDRVLIVFDGVSPDDAILKECELDSRIEIKIEPNKLGFYGHPIREKYQSYFETDYIHNMDDDDMYVPGWRWHLDKLINIKNPDVILFNFLMMNTEFKTVYHPSIYGTAKITGSAVCRNIDWINREKWSNNSGGDATRLSKISMSPKSKTIISEFPIMYKY